MPCNVCNPGVAVIDSGLRTKLPASIEDQLPGVLEDLTELAECTVPRASFRVVTSTLSCTFFNMVAPSDPEKLGGLAISGLRLCEKNSGDVRPSASFGGNAVGLAKRPRSILRGGVSRARGFFGARRLVSGSSDSMSDNLFPLPRDDVVQCDC